MARRGVGFAACLAFSFFLLAAPARSEVRSLALGLAGDVSSLLAPSPVDRAEWALLAAGIAGTAILSPLDVRAYREFRREVPNPRISGLPAARHLSRLGSGEVQLDLLIALAVLGGDRERAAAGAALESLAATGIVVAAMKYATGVPRPSDSPERRQWNRISMRNDAFPSGHTAAAFAVATVLGRAYDAELLAWGAATLVGLSRIHERAHWPSDVLAGAVIGTLIGRRAAALHSLGPDVAVLPSRDGATLALSAKF